MKNFLPIALAFIAGVSGGLLSRYIAPPAAFAQNQQRPEAEIRARSFVLVDPADRPVGTFTTETSGMRNPAGYRVILRDPSGRIIWGAGGTGIHPATTER